MSSSQVRVGEYDLASEEGEQDCDQDGWCAPLPQDFTPTQILVHPQYNRPTKFQNDIAVIKLDRDVIVNGISSDSLSSYCSLSLDYVSPVCLPFSEMMTSTLDSDPEVAGWGAVDPLARRFSDILQYVIVPLADKEDCKDIYKV